MDRNYRTYTQEFKLEALELLKASGKSAAQIERELGITKGLLAKRLWQLQRSGIIEKQHNDSGRNTTEYHLTQAGQELQGVINALLTWGSNWAFDDPSAEQLDPLLLMWWMRNRVKAEALPEKRVTVQFEFHGVEVETYWLVLERRDITLCLTDPGYEINVMVTAELAEFFKLWRGRVDYEEALHRRRITVEGIPRLVRSFPGWFAWSPAAPAVRAARATGS